MSKYLFHSLIYPRDLIRSNSDVNLTASPILRYPNLDLISLSLPSSTGGGGGVASVFLISVVL